MCALGSLLRSSRWRSALCARRTWRSMRSMSPEERGNGSPRSSVRASNSGAEGGDWVASTELRRGRLGPLAPWLADATECDGAAMEGRAEVTACSGWDAADIWAPAERYLAHASNAAGRAAAAELRDLVSTAEPGEDDCDVPGTSMGFGSGRPRLRPGKSQGRRAASPAAFSGSICTLKAKKQAPTAAPIRIKTARHPMESGSGPAMVASIPNNCGSKPRACQKVIPTLESCPPLLALPRSSSSAEARDC
mmetsp:Transcript_144564/g.402849  ORF Transcript_144564/g.402849 Transcript_144564/m.402849 type:complete len:250 (-) Transcript_144564:188-937(-)